MGLRTKQEILSTIPQVDLLLQTEALVQLQNTIPRSIVADGVRRTLQEIRQQILFSTDVWFPQDYLAEDMLISRISETIAKELRPHLHPVINATGVVVHTNLGRAPLAAEATQQLVAISGGYSNLEIDEESGVRGQRYSHVVDLLCRLSGAEDAIVVNNNAAAVLLILSGMAQGHEVIVSRGEQVEVGGSFRIPDIMRQSGCTLVEVGATNKTYLRDYAAAITPQTGALLKVHTSNYRVVGFTAEVPRQELVHLAHQHNVPVLEDLGSGSLLDLSRYGLSYEPTVRDVLAAGIDVVSFSGDKLLGGPQAGIILGKKQYIERLRYHPLNRALRIDKLTLSALEATLKLYLDEEQAVKRIPVLHMLTQPLEQVTARAEKFAAALHNVVTEGIQITQDDVFAAVGGGALPLEQLPSKAVALHPSGLSVDQLDMNLRMFATPVFSRIAKDSLLLDMRTVADHELERLVEAVAWAVQRERQER